MNASDYLKQRGWRGLGYSLDKHDRGIARPLLTSRKDDNLGVGLKKTAPGAVSDEWWLKALDEGLKDMGKGEVRFSSKRKKFSSEEKQESLSLHNY